MTDHPTDELLMKRYQMLALDCRGMQKPRLFPFGCGEVD